jgi:hypothetical protein
LPSEANVLAEINQTNRDSDPKEENPSWPGTETTDSPDWTRSMIAIQQKTENAGKGDTTLDNPKSSGFNVQDNKQAKKEQKKPIMATKNDQSSDDSYADLGSPSKFRKIDDEDDDGIKEARVFNMPTMTPQEIEKLKKWLACQGEQIKTETQ